MPLVIHRNHAPSGLEKWGATVTAKGSGWKKLQDRLARYQRDMALDFWENDVNSIAQNHLEYARQLCPKGTGRLAASLYLTQDHTEHYNTLISYIPGLSFLGSYRFASGDKSRPGGALSIESQFQPGRGSFLANGRVFRGRYYLTTDNPVAWYVEYGTSKMPAQPFMRPAYAFAREMFLIRVRANALEVIR